MSSGVSGPATVGAVRADDLVTVVVSHAVPAPDEAAFLEWQRRMTEAERAAPGHVASELLRPIPGVQDEWIAVTRFAGGPELEAWLGSAARRRVLDDGERFRDFRLQRVGPSFGSWFAGPDAGPDAGPPSWKTALSVLVGLYPTVVLLTLALSALWPGAPLWAGLLVGNVLSVGVLTWVVMPVVTRALRFWLEPAAPRRGTDVLGSVVSLVFLAGAAAVFWLVTT